MITRADYIQIRREAYAEGLEHVKAHVADTADSRVKRRVGYLSSLYATYIPTSGTTMIIIQSKVVGDID